MTDTRGITQATRFGDRSVFGRLVSGVPLIITIATIITGSIVAWTTMKLTQTAHGEDLQTLETVDAEFRPRIDKLEQAQEGMHRSLQAIQQAQSREITRQAADRVEIIGAIKELSRRIGNAPP